MISLITTCVPNRIEASSGNEITKTVGQGVVWTAKGVGKIIYWTGKGMYKIAEYFVVEMLRPVKAIRDKMIDVWGVSGKE